jgi:uncharacterized damage-inducible protein DinB
MDLALIDKFAADAPRLRQSIAGLSPAELRSFPIPGTWSIQQIVLHMMDSDLIGCDRMKRVAAEDRPPTLIGYDETAFARELCYHELDPQLACDDRAFSKTGHHNEHGAMSLTELLATYVDHLEHHLKFIDRKRKLIEQSRG